MNILQLTPGAGAMYCGNCFRDNALVGALRKMGHQVLMVPLYLPLKVDETDQSAGTPIFFNGINVYLDQKTSFYRKAPNWVRDTVGSTVLKWVADKAAQTRPEDVGEITLSMIRGEEGHQARELDQLVTWLKKQPRPNVICLSNALLVGMARKLKAEFGALIVCMLQGEDSFLDALPEATRKPAWQALAERAADVDLFIAPSHYFGGLMGVRLGLPEHRVQIVHNGINLDGYFPEGELPDPPVLGYFARMCRDKGLHTLVEAYILLRQRDRIKDLKLKVGGGCGPADEPFVAEIRDRLKSQKLLGEVEFCPNLDRAGKQAFYRSLTAFSVPALYGEAFGLYVLEALASGVAVVQPRHAAFPELIQATGGGTLCEPGDPKSLAEQLEQMLSNAILRKTLADNGRQKVLSDFSAERMAENMLAAFGEAAAAKV
jgi:glycosyltransferase involved in cell wall biosynthesis